MHFPARQSRGRLGVLIGAKQPTAALRLEDVAGQCALPALPAHPLGQHLVEQLAAHGGQPQAFQRRLAWRLALPQQPVAGAAEIVTAAAEALLTEIIRYA